MCTKFHGNPSKTPHMSNHGGTGGKVRGSSSSGNQMLCQSIKYECKPGDISLNYKMIMIIIIIIIINDMLGHQMKSQSKTKLITFHALRKMTTINRQTDILNPTAKVLALLKKERNNVN